VRSGNNLEINIWENGIMPGSRSSSTVNLVPPGLVSENAVDTSILENITNRVPQGLISCSLLLLFYINDVPKITDNDAKAVLLQMIPAL
jgi:hypothetical protein